MEIIDKQDDFSAKSKEITFLGKEDYAIHNWFRMTASFSPALVQSLLSSSLKNKKNRILEPFCGVGTTPVESALNGFSGTAIELNPVFHQVSSTKLYWIKNCNRIAELNEAFNYVSDKLKKIDKKKYASIEEVANNFGQMPSLVNIERWFVPSAVGHLFEVKNLISESPFSTEVKEFLRTASLCSLLNVSNVEHNRVSLTASKVALPYNGIRAPYLKKLERMIDDIQSVQGKRIGEFNVVRGDSRFANESLGDEKFDLIITSPPYPNRFSYTRETRPHMFMLDLIKNVDDVGELEMKSIGGTWGRATSRLMKPYVASKITARACAPYLDQLNDDMMKNYILIFFDSILKHVESASLNLSNGAEVHYVIGNSKIKGQTIPSDLILGQIFKACGFGKIKSYRMRKRHSQTGLYEAIVSARFSEQ